MVLKRFRKRLYRAFIDKIAPDLIPHIREHYPWKQNFFIPSPEAIGHSSDFPFMSSSVCTASDFFHSEFARLCDVIGEPAKLHRKQWEFIYIAHHASQAGVLSPNRRGLAFRVGREPLPAAFAALGCEITATDAPNDLAISNGWKDSNQHATGLAGLACGRLDREIFERRVRWQECDMKAIDPTLVQ